MNTTRVIQPGWIVAAALTTLVVPLAAQDSWQWPERAENLQQLPKDFPPERLRAVMTGFTRALGVRCSHCHVGQEGQPLSSYDFPSDDNPNKRTARAMLKMLGAINEHLKQIEPSGDVRVNMWCHTCHAGKPRPQTLAEALHEAYGAGGIDAALARYRELRQRYYGGAAYDFREPTLNALGYELLGRDQVDDAIAIFRLNAELHPDSANVYDSLGEAYGKAGRKEQARVFYRKSLEIDPDNQNAVAMLEQLAAPE